MRSLAVSGSRLSARMGTLLVIAAGLAGCSGDISRFADAPFSSSAARSGSSEVTGSLPRGHVDAQKLPPPSRPNTSSTGVAGGGSGIGSYHPSGNAAANRAAAPAKPAAGAQAHPAAAVAMHSVAPGETLTSIARRYAKSRAEIAKANNIDGYAMVRVGQKLVIPGMRPASGKTAIPAPARDPAVSAGAAKPQTAAPIQAAAHQPTATARLVTPASEPPQASASATSHLTGAVPSFRWPVRGRVIAGYGAKVNGAPNDGINLAVPEGTSVKAAEDGIVAYAGNELKGYGNLVLVRHANGFVTAYAHASEIMVKRGDQVKRGQLLARAGQTGSVTSPQLHFEIRKGSSPVDPMQYLTGN